MLNALVQENRLQPAPGIPSPQRGLPWLLAPLSLLQALLALPWLWAHPPCGMRPVLAQPSWGCACLHSAVFPSLHCRVLLGSAGPGLAWAAASLGTPAARAGAAHCGGEGPRGQCAPRGQRAPHGQYRTLWSVCTPQSPCTPGHLLARVCSAWPNVSGPGRATLILALARLSHHCQPVAFWLVPFATRFVPWER